MDLVASIIERADLSSDLSVTTVATVVHLIVREHPFWDCNHRTADAYLLALMARLGKRPAVSDVEIARFLRRVDSDDLPERAVLDWIQSSFTG